METAPQTSIRYICSDGVLLEIGDKRILMDGLIRTQLKMYRPMPQSIIEALEQHIPPFDRIDIAIGSHWHPDHFYAKTVEQCLRSHPETTVVTTPDAMARIHCPLSNTVVMDLDPLTCGKVEVDGVTIIGFRAKHMGEQFADVNNVMFTVEYGGKRFLHTGDTPAELDIFTRYAACVGSELDALIAAFPFIARMSTEPVIRDAIHPKMILAVHLPQAEKDPFGWLLGAERNAERYRQRGYDIRMLKTTEDIVYLD